MENLSAIRTPVPALGRGLSSTAAVGLAVVLAAGTSRGASNGAEAAEAAEVPAPAPGERTITIGPGVLEFRPTRADMTVGRAIINSAGNAPFTINGERVEKWGRMIELGELGSNRFRLPELTFAYSETDGGFLCLSVKVWFNEVQNEYDGPYYEVLDDRYALVAYCTDAEVQRDHPRFKQNPAPDLEAFKAALKKPFALRLKGRRLPTPGIAVDGGGTIHVLAFHRGFRPTERSRLYRIAPGGEVEEVPLPAATVRRHLMHAHPIAARPGGGLLLSELIELGAGGEAARVGLKPAGYQVAWNTPVAVDSKGNRYAEVVHRPGGGAGRVTVLARIDPGGQVHPLAGPVTPPGEFPGGGSAPPLGSITALAAGASGSGLLYVADGSVYTGSWVRRVAPGGEVVTLAGGAAVGFADGVGAAARFHTITGIAADAAGNLYLADRFNRRVRKLTPDGTVTTLAGTGQSLSVDGPAARASFTDPTAVAVDLEGNVLVLDSAARIARVRKVTPGGQVVTVATVGTVR